MNVKVWFAFAARSLSAAHDIVLWLVLRGVHVEVTLSEVIDQSYTPQPVDSGSRMRNSHTGKHAATEAVRIYNVMRDRSSEIDRKMQALMVVASLVVGVLISSIHSVGPTPWSVYGVAGPLLVVIFITLSFIDLVSKMYPVIDHVWSMQDPDDFFVEVIKTCHECVVFNEARLQFKSDLYKGALRYFKFGMFMVVVHLANLSS